MKKLKYFITNKKTISVIATCISYSYLCFQHFMPAYHELSWVLFGIILIAFIKTDFTCEEHKDLKSTILILSAIFSLLLVYGNIAYRIMSDRVLSLLRIMYSPKSLLSFIAIFNFIYALLLNIYPKLIAYKMHLGTYNKNKSKYVFLGSLLIILLCWLPYFLRYFPGAMTPDSVSELAIVVNKFTNMTDHHTAMHIIFIAIPYTIGHKIFGSAIAGVATYTVIQMICLASIFAYTILFLYKRKINKYLLILALLYYAIVPIHGYYSIIMWKDIMFGGMTLLLTTELVRILEKEKNNELKFKNMISFIIISILCIFFRNNAIYMYFILAIFTFIFFKKYYKLFLGIFAIVIGTYYIVKWPIFNALNITRSRSSEYIAMPLQQVGRMAYKNVKFTKSEKELIDKIMPVEIMSNAYNPVISDGIKFHKAYNRKEFDDNKDDYFKLWLQLVIKHPSIAIEAYSISTLGYWYPGVEYWSTAKDIYINNFDIKMKPKVSKKMTELIDKLDLRGIPIVGMEWSIGLCYWIVFLFGIVTTKIKNKKDIYVFIPVIGIWITMLLASPVFGEFRYVYGAYTTLPLLMIYPYLKIQNTK